MKKILSGLLSSLLWLSAVGAQNATPMAAGFETFQLGMPVEAFKAELKKSVHFFYQGEPDVTLLSRPNTNLIDVPGVSWISRGVFQIVDGTLYSITLELNPEQLDYHAVYSALTKKYGPPSAMDPSSARWETAQVRLSLERPLTVRYLDLPRFVRFQKEGQAQNSLLSLTREKFLENF